MDGAPVLHRAEERAAPWHGDHVELGQRIRRAEVIVEPGQRLDGGLERIATGRRGTLARHDADIDAGDGLRNALELADRQVEQVGRHRAGCVAKRTRCFSPSACVEATGMFEYADSPLGIITSRAKVALVEGSSHIGANRRRIAHLELRREHPARSGRGVVVDGEQA